MEKAIMCVTMLFLTIVLQNWCANGFDSSKCSLNPDIKNDIVSYKSTVKKIINEILTGDFKGSVYRDLAEFVDKFGSRLSGSIQLEKSLDYLRRKMKRSGLTNVHTEPVVIQKWFRGSERAYLVEPWRKKILSLACLYSIGLPLGGIRSEIVMLYSDNDLKENPEKFEGKIVAVYDEIGLRDDWRLELEKLRPSAILLTKRYFGIYGVFRACKFKHNITQQRVPSVEITYQDMDLFNSIHKKGKSKLVMELSMKEPLGAVNVISRNVIGEYEGVGKPGEIVGLGGHVDTWDVGQGVQDDGFGVILVLQTINVLKKMGIQPKRTIRALLWTGEEIGRKGSKEYCRVHKNEMDKFQAGLEADSGCLSYLQLRYNGGETFGCIAYEILKLIQPLVKGLGFAYRSNWSSDMTSFKNNSVPTLGLGGDPRYFWYHHTNADTMSSAPPHVFDRCLATYAATAYVVADMKTKIPSG